MVTVALRLDWDLEASRAVKLALHAEREGGAESAADVGKPLRGGDATETASSAARLRAAEP